MGKTAARWGKAGLVILGWPGLFLFGVLLGIGWNWAEDWVKQEREKKNRAAPCVG